MKKKRKKKPGIMEYNSKRDFIRSVVAASSGYQDFIRIAYRNVNTYRVIIISQALYHVPIVRLIGSLVA